MLRAVSILRLSKAGWLASVTNTAHQYTKRMDTIMRSELGNFGGIEPPQSPLLSLPDLKVRGFSEAFSEELLFAYEVILVQGRGNDTLLAKECGIVQFDDSVTAVEALQATKSRAESESAMEYKREVWGDNRLKINITSFNNIQ